MRGQIRKAGYRLLSLLAIMAVVILIQGIDVLAKSIEIESTGAGGPENPVHHCTQEDDGSDYTDWSYVYFGSYPQSEVTGSALTSAITGASYDANGDAWVNGTKYRRISKSDTNYDEYFGSCTYRYFKWERIKWRVLKNNGSTLFVVADKGLDCKRYNDTYTSVTWETCTLRNWLNNDFYGMAFSSNEQNAIVLQNVVNEDNPYYGTDGGNDTKDKVYLLSIGEVTDSGYGFCESYRTYSVSRRVRLSDYAHARGAMISTDNDYAENCWWWLRSPGSKTYGAAYVIGHGNVFVNPAGVSLDNGACVPALHINLSSNLWYQTDDGTSGHGGSLGNKAPNVIISSYKSVKEGTGASFSVSASGGNPSNYTYQWYYATSLSGTGTKISGATSSLYGIIGSDMTPSLNGRYYYCVVSNGQYNITSSRAKLTVYYAPTVTSPTAKSVKAGTSTTFSVSASGGNPSSYTYQWYYATSETGAGIQISGETSSSYTITASNMTTSLNGRYYYCVVSNGQYDIPSDRAKLTVTESGQGTLSGMPANPVHHCTNANDGSDYTDWSYIYFGSYPQSEVIGSALTSAITGASYNANGDAWVNGVKYRRISKSDTNNNEYFGDSTYRYFKWERIKWRVLRNNGSTLFVMADKGLDCKNYNETNAAVTWETCTLRNWLNDTFYKTAFSSNEQNAIVQQNVVNEDNPEYGTEAGNNTMDKVYLLSIGEITDLGYGFCETSWTKSVSRRVQSSDYAHARGTWIYTDSDYEGNCWWWLRSPGGGTNYAAYVDVGGYVVSNGNRVFNSYGACAPALHINLTSNLWYSTDDATSGAGGIVPVIPTVSSPSSKSVKAGESTSFFVSASGGNPSNYIYQWYYATSETGTGTRISGATSSSYSISSSDMTTALNGRYYYCVVSNGIYDMPSSRAKLTVYYVPTIVSEPSATSVKAGTNAIFSVSASGGNPSNYTYQWYYATSETGTGTRISGAILSSYTISSGDMTSSLDGRYYYCIVSNGQYDVTSNRAKLTVLSPPTVTGLAEWYSTAAGTSLDLEVTASDGTPSSYTYQWYYAMTQDGTGIKINGATFSKYTIPASIMDKSLDGRYYYCVVSNGAYDVESSRTKIFVYNETKPQNTGGNGGNSILNPVPQTIQASSYTKEYKSKPFYLNATTNGNGALSYSSNNKKVATISSDGKVKVKNYGTATITIKASQTAEYNPSTKKVKIKVVPRKVKLIRVTSPASRKISIKWKKDKKVIGYELNISLSKAFRSKTSRKTFDKSKSGIALSGLQSGKNYFVRIRSYAKAGKKTYYSEWSKIGSVKIK